MADIDKKRMARDMAIARFAKFVDKYLYGTNWTVFATMYGIIDVLDQPRHERVRRAQSFRDDDYVESIIHFLREVFDSDEQLGLAFIYEIADQEELSQEAKDELAKILLIFGQEKPDATALLRSIKITALNKFIDVTSYPDDFYKKLIEEINLLYINRLPMSLSILIRKLLENLIIDILRKKYGTAELSLYYDTSRGRFHDFSFLLRNLDSKKDDFRYISAGLDSSLIRRIDRYRETWNSGAHSIDIDLSIDQTSKDKDEINYLVQFLLRILQNI